MPFQRLRQVAGKWIVFAALAGCGPSQVATLDPPDGGLTGSDARSIEPDIDAAPRPDARPDAANPGPDAEPDPDAEPAAYTHTIAIDGVNDFIMGFEQVTTTTGSFHAFVSWDADYLYLGLAGPDVAANSGTKFWLIYLGGVNGTSSGEDYNTQRPQLAFSAQTHIRWRTNNSFTSAKQWTGTAWQEAGWSFAGDLFQQGQFVEMRVPRADLGSPDAIQVHMSMINENGGVEATFAGAPQGSFSDGYDPDYARFYQFDLGDDTPPSSYLPLP